jgi:glutamine---fructose-6-phosphate transaminase (isomerizing)
VGLGNIGMAKEIHEQPEVVGHTLANYFDIVAERVALPMTLPFDFRALGRISIAACGTAYSLLRGMIARDWSARFRAAAGRSRHRGGVPLPRGATPSRCACSLYFPVGRDRRYAGAHGQHVLSIVNVPTSTIARESDVVMPTLAGTEIGVASTKAFTCACTSQCSSKHRSDYRERQTAFPLQCCSPWAHPETVVARRRIWCAGG